MLLKLVIFPLCGRFPSQPPWVPPMITSAFPHFVCSQNCWKIPRHLSLCVLTSGPFPSPNPPVGAFVTSWGPTASVPFLTPPLLQEHVAGVPSNSDCWSAETRISGLEKVRPKEPQGKMECPCHLPRGPLRPPGLLWTEPLPAGILGLWG